MAEQTKVPAVETAGAQSPSPAQPAPSTDAQPRKRKPRGEGGSVYVLCYEDGTYTQHAKDTVTAAVSKPEKGKKIRFLVRGVPAVPRVETIIRLGS